MFKKIIFLLLILTMIISCYFQTNHDLKEIENLINNDRFSEAINLSTKNIEKNMKDERFYYNRGYCYNILEKQENAIDDFTNCIKINPKYSDGYYGLAEIYSDNKQFDLAEKNYNKAIELAANIKRKAVYFNGLASLYGQKKDFKKAIEFNNQAIKLYEIGDFYYFLGKNLYFDGKKDEAVNVWKQTINEKKFIQIKFKHQTYYYLSVYYYHIKDLNTAKEYLEKGLELSPNNKDYLDLYNIIQNDINK